VFQYASVLILFTLQKRKVLPGIWGTDDDRRNVGHLCPFCIIVVKKWMDRALPGCFKFEDVAVPCR
jgi:hypothetical protein